MFVEFFEKVCDQGGVVVGMDLDVKLLVLPAQANGELGAYFSWLQRQTPEGRQREPCVLLR